MEVIQAILDRVVLNLKDVPGIDAIVLGGSRARGTNLPDSDIDIGIYYTSDQLDLSKLQVAAQQLDDEHRTNLIAPPGGWGKWVNGGAWLNVNGFPLDLILRDTQRVKTAVEECENGIVSAHYQPGHPHAFLNTMYRGELAICRLLGDPSTEFIHFKQNAESYPVKMKTEILNLFNFEADFSSALATKYCSKNDPYYVTAHLIRSISSLNQVLFALNEQYCLNEKKAVQMIDSFPIHPQNYADRVAGIFSNSVLDLTGACDQLQELINETRNLLADDR